jgi:hypothetical protein
MKFFIPETGCHGILGSFDLFPQHCLLLMTSPAKHARTMKLREAIMVLPKKRW